MVQNIYKSWLLVSQITRGTWRPTDKQWKVQKFKFDGLLSKTYSPSAKTLNTEDLSNITFNYLCENSPNSSCHFSSKKSVFLLKFGSFSSVMRDNCSVLFWLKLYIDKSSTIAKFLMFLPNSSCHFWNQDSVFLQTLHHSSVSWDITLLCFFI